MFLSRGDDLPEEREMAVGVFAGPRSAPHWSVDGGHMDFFDAKGALEALLRCLGVEPVFALAKDATFQTGRAAGVSVLAAGDLRVAVVGEVTSDVLAAMDIDLAPVAMFEVDLRALASAVTAATKTGSGYEPFGRFPESTRDLALVADEGVPADDVVRLVERNRLAVEATVFDVYKGEGLPEGKKSLAVHVVYRSPKRTLTADDVSRAEQAILRALASELGAELRE